MILWCSIAFGMGIMALLWGAPIFFTLVAFGMGSFGIMICITIAKQQGASYPLPRRTRRDYVTYTGDSMSHDYSSSSDRKSYEAPSTCPSCGVSISTDEVDWVAPLKAVCPYCETIMDAVERSW